VEAYRYRAVTGFPLKWLSGLDLTFFAFKQGGNDLQQVL
jgi:hypothetical protein